MNTEWTSAPFRAALLALVRRRVPDRDAEDVVQSILAEALASPQRPAEPEAARRWLWGVAKHKVVDYHRRARREVMSEPEAVLEAPSHEAEDLLRWALEELPDTHEAKKTLHWLLRESEGEKLDEIAESQRLPPAQVRQRVSRLRRHFRERWAYYCAAGLFAALLYVALRARSPQPAPRRMLPDPAQLEALARARTLRAEAARLCANNAFDACARALDTARSLDPDGERAPEVRAARQRIESQRLAPPAPRLAPPPPPAPPPAVPESPLPPPRRVRPAPPQFMPPAPPAAPPFAPRPRPWRGWPDGGF